MADKVAKLSNRLYIPSEYVSPSILSEFRYTFTRMDPVREYDEDEDEEIIRYERRKEIHLTCKERGGVWGFHRGDLNKLRRLFGHLRWHDYRASPPMEAPLQLKKEFRPRHNQKECFEKFIASSGGGLVQADTGWGKTVFGVWVAIHLGTRTLVLASQTNWLEDWLKDIRKHTNIQQLEDELGHPICGIVSNDDDPMPCISLCTFQSFYSGKGKVMRAGKLRDAFGLVIADEASMLPAPETSGSFTAFNPRWRMGLSADERRSDEMHKLTYDYVGPVIAKGKRGDTIPGEVIMEPSGVTINARSLWGKHWLGQLQNRIANNYNFSRLIVFRAMQDVKEGYRVLIISNRRKHVRQLASMIENEEYSVKQRNKKTGKTRVRWKCPTVTTMMGQDPYFDEKKTKVRNGEIDVVVATQVVQMNTDLPRIDCLHDVMPVNNDQGIKQRAGRIRRAHEDKMTPVRIRVWDFVGVPPNRASSRYLSATWKRRRGWYENNGFDVIELDADGNVIETERKGQGGGSQFIMRKGDW